MCKCMLIGLTGMDTIRSGLNHETCLNGYLPTCLPCRDLTETKYQGSRKAYSVIESKSLATQLNEHVGGLQRQAH